MKIIVFGVHIGVPLFLETTVYASEVLYPSKSIHVHMYIYIDNCQWDMCVCVYI